MLPRDGQGAGRGARSGAAEDRYAPSNATPHGLEHDAGSEDEQDQHADEDLFAKDAGGYKQIIDREVGTGNRAA